jgi:hypothetical protein
VRRAAAALALAAVALALPAACSARPTSPSACPASTPTRSGSLQVLQAEPPESSIRGILESQQPATAGRPYPVRWLVDARKASTQIRFQAAREGTSEVYRQAFPGSGVSGQLAEFPSQLVFPASGCWDADVFTGTALGSLTFRVA